MNDTPPTCKPGDLVRIVRGEFNNHTGRIANMPAPAGFVRINIMQYLCVCVGTDEIEPCPKHKGKTKP